MYEQNQISTKSCYITFALRGISGYELESGSDRSSLSSFAEKNIFKELAAII